MGRFISDEEVSALEILQNRGEITEEEMEDAFIAGNPVLWIETYLNDPDEPNKAIVLREFQREVLRDANTVCIRWGRQMGKSFLLAARLLWESITEKNTRCLLFAPRKKHITDIFEYVEKMIKSSPHLKSMILDNKSRKGGKKLEDPEDSLPRIRFTNGSVIVFFHTQSKVARELIRGTKGGKIFLEETALIDEETMTAMSGLMTSSKDVFIYAQSTPRGKGNWYYEFSLGADLHSHHASHESPDWTPEKEKAARMLAGTETGYRQEFLAEFVDDGFSAFTDAAIDEAEDNAKSAQGELTFRDNSFLSTEQIRAVPGNVFMGIDWNVSENGTKITVWKNPTMNTSVLWYQDIISIEHPVYTQLTAIDKMFELIKLYNPKMIAIDQGYAATQVELINKKLEDPEFFWIKDIIEIVDFGRIIHIPIDDFYGTSNMETDIVNNDEDDISGFSKTTLKNLMVSITNRMLLTGYLAIGPIDIDTERKTLLNEMRSVKVEKFNSNNRPVYSKKGLHKFSSAILAIYAFYLVKGKYKIINENGKLFLRKGDWESHQKADAILGFNHIASIRHSMSKVMSGNSQRQSREMLANKANKSSSVNYMKEDIGPNGAKSIAKSNDNIGSKSFGGYLSAYARRSANDSSIRRPYRSRKI